MLCTVKMMYLWDSGAAGWLHWTGLGWLFSTGKGKKKRLV
jgi:hypothetical protein